MSRLLPLGFVAVMLLACAGVESPPDAGPDAPDAGPGCPVGSHEVEGGCDAQLTWSPTTALPGKRDHHATFAVETPAGTFLYVAGGAPDRMSMLDEVLRAPVREDGTLGEWEELGPLPEPIGGAGLAVFGRRVLLVGGMTDTSMYSDKTWLAEVGDDGALGAWRAGPDLPLGVFHVACAQDGARVWCTGGLRVTDNVTQVVRTEFRDDGTLAPFEEVRALPEKRSHHSSVVAGGRLYVLGGITGGPANDPLARDDVIAAAIAGDGSLGEWTNVGTLPVPVASHASLAHAGRVWTFGGIESNANYSKAVRRARFAADGTLADADEASLLPLGRGHVHQLPLVGPHLYSCGGSRGSGPIDHCNVGLLE